MRIITVVNAKGGCGKSTISMSLAVGLANRGFKVLLLDLDPQAQLTQWLDAGDGFSTEGTITNAFLGRESLSEVAQKTEFENLFFISSSQGLEKVGHRITEDEGHHKILIDLLYNYQEELIDQKQPLFDFLIIDSPNQVSPIMANGVHVSDLFIVPFESTKTVRSYPNFLELVMQHRTDGDYEMLHVLNNIPREGLKNDIIRRMEADNIRRAKSEIRTCGWLARVDEHGGSIFQYRPKSKGSSDMSQLIEEVLQIFSPSKTTEGEVTQEVI